MAEQTSTPNRCDLVDINVISCETDYSPRAGLEYEVAPGIRAKMRIPTEGVIEEYEAQARKENDETRSDKEVAFDQAKVALELPEGKSLDTIPRENRIYSVIDRAADDFFFLWRPRPSKQMQSYMLAVRQLQSAQVASEETSLQASPAGQSPSSSNGQPGGKTAEATGPTAISA